MTICLAPDQLDRLAILALIVAGYVVLAWLGGDRGKRAGGGG